MADLFTSCEFGYKDEKGIIYRRNILLAIIPRIGERVAIDFLTPSVKHIYGKVTTIFHEITPTDKQVVYIGLE